MKVASILCFIHVIKAPGINKVDTCVRLTQVNTMGQAYAKASSSYDISKVKLLTEPASFTVIRTSGEEDDGWTLCRQPQAREALFPESDQVIEYPLATHVLVDKTGSVVDRTDEGKVWRVLLENGTGLGSLFAWRRLEKIWPSGMSKEDAIAWRIAVTAALNALEA
jgi:hypothetical protein